MTTTDENTEKAFQADPAQLEPAIEPTAASNGTPPPATEAAANELTPGQHAFALRQAETVIASESTADGNGDGDFTSTFASAPPVPGEFRLPLSKLAEWVYHPRAGSREKGEHFHALALTAAEPDDLRPLVVLDEIDGVYPIVDGRFLWHALKETNAGNEDVGIRCVRFVGTEADAVAAVCDTALGTIEASPMEKAQALLNLQQVNGISQRAIAERYPRLTKDKVSNMLIAARMRQAYPMLFDILDEPDMAPISYGTTILTRQKELPSEAFQAMLELAEDVAANGERFKPNQALAALYPDGDAQASSDNKTVKPKPVIPLKSEDIFGHDDQPVAAYQRFSDDINRISLPDVSDMSIEERQAAAEACIAVIRHHFGLDQQN